MRKDSNKNAPTAEKILSTLFDLYADQCGVKITYQFEDSKGGHHEQHHH